MKSILTCTLLLISLLTLNSIDLFAGHVAGGSIKYKYVGPGSTPGTYQYYVEASVLRDCAGVAYTVTTAAVTAKCSGSSTVTNFSLSNLPFVAPTPTPFGGPYVGISQQSGSTTMVAEEVSDVCDKVLNPNQNPLTNCRGGTIQGYMRFKYASLITLTQCNYWTLGHTITGGRNTGNANINSANLYVEVRFDNLNFPTNSSPHFLEDQRSRPNVCVGQTSYYSVAVQDQEHDSITYNLACVRTSPTACANYVGNFSYTQPVANFNLDTVTGEITLTPASAGKRMIGYWVKEYERCTGRWKAQTLRDFQFNVHLCANKPAQFASVSALTGNGAVRLGDRKIKVQKGTWVSFKDTFTDPNTVDTVYLTSTLKDVFPQSSMTITSLSKNQSVATYNFFVPSLAISRQIFFQTRYTDDRCDIPGQGITTYTLLIDGAGGLLADIHGINDTFNLCTGDTSLIELSGSDHYTWKSISGDTFKFSGPGQNIWLDTVPGDTNFQAHIQVQNPTQVEVSALATLFCNNTATLKKDTFWLIPGTRFNLSTSSDTALCYDGVSFGISAQPNLSGYTYQYKWEPSNLVSNDTIASPTVGDSVSANYTVTVENNEGCIQTQSVFVKSFQRSDSLVLTTNTQHICAGDSVQINVNLFDPTQSPFGHPREDSLLHILQPATPSGTPFNTSSAQSAASWPCPFGVLTSKARQRYLYRKSDLIAMGLDSLDFIYSLGFAIRDLHGVNSIPDYNLKIGLTSDTAVSGWNQGLTAVHYSQNLSLHVGWNYLNFNQGFQWDGKSNLIVEVCYDRNGVTGNNPAVYYGVTSYLCNIVTNQASSPAICTNQMLSLSSAYQLPMIALKTMRNDPSYLYDYTWTPSHVLSDSLAPNPKAGITQNTTIGLAIQYKEGVCPDTAQITLISSPDPQFAIGPDTATCEAEVLTFTSSHQSPFPASYSWSPAAQFVDPSLAQVSFNVPSGQTQVIAKLTDSLGCEYFDTLVVTGSPVPIAGISTFGPFCERDSINALQAQFQGGYFYGKSVDSITGNFNAHHPDFLATYNHPDLTTINFKAVSGIGCEKDTSFQVRVDPVFDTTYTGSRMFCDNDSTVMLQAKHPGGTWSGPGVSGTHFSPYVAGTGTHQIRVDSNGYCGNSAVYSFYVNPMPSKAVPDSVMGCTGNPAIIDAGNPGSVYQWSNGKSSQVITETQSGTLQLITTDAQGCKRTDTINVMVELICLGVAQVDLENRIRAYPNPTSDRMVIEIPFTVQNPGVFWIIDNQGKRVMSHSIADQNKGQYIELDVQHLAIGSYRLVGMLDGNPIEIAFQVSR
ncbi:hypothetical protein KFE98_09015 [bacterium SCSIO 12741]|nr:hypothetical protein KFE98_09015 [bacterium SCSIO 12741]